MKPLACNIRSTGTHLIVAFIIFNLFSHISLGTPMATLPVVVHVIHTGQPVGALGNPPDSLILAMINLMNDVFQKNGPLYGGADMELAFALAIRSPDCQSTNGIMRIDGSGVEDYSTGGITSDTFNFPNSAHEIFIKELSRWPNTDYINIWIVHMIDGNPNGTAGYAYYPQYNSALTDGIVIRADVVDGMTKTIIHELGHYFNLAHPFGTAWSACEIETDCETQGDLICDTEPCMFTFDCSLTENPCSDEPWIIVDPEFDYTVLNNYMGFTDCAWMFTEGQKDRMWNAILDFRPGLLSSLGINLPPDGYLEDACIPTAVNGLSPFYGIERVEFGTLNVYSNSSQADGLNYIDRTCNQAVTVEVGDTVFIQITSSFENFQKIRVYLDLDNDGVFDLPNELILSANGGVVNGQFIIPSSALHHCNPIRLRIAGDHPGASDPTPCLLEGTNTEGAGQIEDYSVIVTPRQVVSVASGNWNDPSVWNCNCIPSEGDAITISSGHLITVPLSLGTVYCAQINLLPDGEVSAFGNIHVAKGCDD